MTSAMRGGESYDSPPYPYNCMCGYRIHLFRYRACSRTEIGIAETLLMERLAEVGRSATDEADLSFCLTAQKEIGWQQSNNK